MREIWIVLGLTFAASDIIMALVLWTTSVSCHRRWEDSGLQSRWSIMASCQIKYQGAWIPEDRYRVVPE